MAFWILKRHTSYTAWERAWRAFAALYQAMECRRPELREGGSDYGIPYHPWNDWPMWEFMVDIGRDMRECLRRLRHGDKSVLAYSMVVPDSQKTFEDWLRALIELCYYALVGIHPRDGQMSILSTPVFPDQEHIISLAVQSAKLYKENIEIPKIRHLRVGAHVPVNLIWGGEYSYSAVAPPPRGHCDGDAFTIYPVPEDLPPLPEPVLFRHKAPSWWAPKGQLSGPHVVKSGELTVYPGIYVSGSDDGLLYSPGTQAPYRYPEHQDDKKPVACDWTLIWLDDRYKDEAPLPEEEKLYFPDEEERKAVAPEFAEAFPGDPCPRSGMWFANFLSGPHQYFRQGDIMPGPKSNSMGAVIWYWLQDEKYPEA
jgi:hypothetical protein